MISINVLIVEFYRTLKSEVEELKELDQEREKYYELKCSEMNEFMQNVERFRSDNRLKVQNPRDQVKESGRSRSFIPSSWSPASNLSIAYRTLKSEVEELKELDQEREKYYELKCSEMNEFMQNVERFRSDNRLKVQNPRDQVKEV
ncbi:hypothetical protein Bca52824_048995 [Brassica carinata]|uniref:Uncharacterized protein n=1 Tax=Brassica carinata TaxID=52824 RepID=A0A8X7RJD9_BRACI|nr:hypothetical protein Bca52824_048995 [Brassica carinata]